MHLLDRPILMPAGLLLFVVALDFFVGGGWGLRSLFPVRTPPPTARPSPLAPPPLAAEPTESPVLKDSVLPGSDFGTIALRLAKDGHVCRLLRQERDAVWRCEAPSGVLAVELTSEGADADSLKRLQLTATGHEGDLESALNWLTLLSGDGDDVASLEGFLRRSWATGGTAVVGSIRIAVKRHAGRVEVLVEPPSS